MALRTSHRPVGSKRPFRKRDSGEFERREKARELSQRSGIPLHLAFHVIDGRTTLNDVLRKMMLREKARRLMEDYGLSASVAGQVARGHASLEKVVARGKRRASRFWKARYSIFDVEEHRACDLAILSFGRPWRVGRLCGVEKYEFEFEAEEGTEVLQKHDVKVLLFSPEQIDVLRNAMSVDEEVQKRGLSATVDLKERLKIDKEDFFEEIRGGERLRFVFRDGDFLEGVVNWFARYEFGLTVAENVEAVGFFHALLSHGPVDAADASSGEATEPSEKPSPRKKEKKVRQKPVAGKKKKHRRRRR